VNSHVVDASVVAAAFFNESGSEAARRLLASEGRFLAPDFLPVEVANVIWKRYGRGEVDEDEARRLLYDCLRLPLTLRTSHDILPDAMRLALRYRCTVYDCLYLAMALKEESVLVTADARLVNALKGTPLQKYAALLGKA
jgi:predicted nucleic acid-binding protein